MTIDTTTTPTPDLTAVKARQQATWATGDYHVIGARIILSSELLIESLDLRSTERVLDVATGSGNAALAAARRNCEVIGIDYVPALLEHARRRADVEGLSATFIDGDAEALPFDDASFDVTASVFGAMFAPDHAKTASELARVTKPGGRIGLVAHTPDGFIGQLFKTVGKHVPPPAGVASPVLWGTTEHLEELFGDDIAELRTERRQLVFRYPSAEAYVAEWRRFYGPTSKAFDAVGEAGADALAADILDLVGRFDRAGDGSMVVANDYLEAVIVRR